MIRPLATIALVLAVLAGCGGDDSGAVGAESAASIAPASAPVFASIDSDLGSDQWRQLDELLERFPGRDRLVDELRSALADEGVTADDIDRAFGPTVDVIVLSLDDEDGAGVFATQTDDIDALEALLAKGEDDDWVIEEVGDGWVAFSDEQSSLDALDEAQGAKLADDEGFSEAMAKLPDEALAKVYVDGEALAGRLDAAGAAAIPNVSGKLVRASAAFVAEDDGVRVQAWAKGDGSDEAPDVGELLEDVPEGVIAFLDVGLGGTEELEGALESQPGATEALGGIEAVLGVGLDDLTALFGDETLLYVRPGLLIPEVTLVLKTDGDDAKRTVDRLLEAAATLTGGDARPTDVDGLDGTEVSLGPVSIYAVAAGDRVIVSTLKSGIAEYRSDGDKLRDDDRYTDALDAAGVGDDEDVYLYVDVDETWGLVSRLAQLADEPLPADANENVEPLRAFVVSGKVDGDETESSMFLSVD